MADATQVQRRRGTQAQCDAGTPVEGEIWVDTTYDTLRVGDGSKAGGYIMPNAFQLQGSTFNYGIAGGSENALTVTLYPVPSSVGGGFSFKFRASANNTDASTINVNGLGAVEIRKIEGTSIVSLTENDLVNNGVYEVTHNGTYFVLGSGSAGESNILPGDIRLTKTYSEEIVTPVANSIWIRPTPTQSDTYTRWMIPYKGQITATIDMGSSSTLTSLGWFLNNALIIQIDRESSNFVTYSRNISVEKGDVLDVRVRRTSSALGSVVIRNTLISCDRPLPPILGF